MSSIELDHIIYATIPYKGYGVRAWSSKDKLENFRQAFQEWYAPFEQNTIRPGYEARVLIKTSIDEIYLARIFTKEKMDEKGRTSIVSHIVEIPIELLRQGLPLEVVDSEMTRYTMSSIGIGEVPKIRIVWEKQSEDPDIRYLKEHVDETTARKILEGFSKPKPRIVIIYKRDYWERIRMVYAITKLLIEANIKIFSIFSDTPPDHIIRIFHAPTIVTNIMPRIRPSEDWTVINIKTGEKGAEHTDIDSVLRKIYREHQ
ncbi:hypothetical protein Igag_0820 [Ignisphaera aggregans DSM 17230]|uniref:Uncharacterized protein n=1 Tax=Ignisphaera aggregans (strain DSM 17230 / JCM 13409 / AQ1.S1) TaxID=583356 RepID=E0STM7_IGNAA|nr:hypothetical protein Igag_0820 [Ignisphaera aggregans DSM 17230]